ncbi:MAG: periplasmic heavy metal sensor [Planctomycetota bacterium]
MFTKTFLAAALLLAGGTAPTQSRDLESLLPPPQWMLAHAEEIGLAPAQAEELRGRFLTARRATTDAREELQPLRTALREALSAPTLDRAAIEARFEALLDAECRIKREQLRARLDVLEVIPSGQRALLRTAATRAAEQRSILRVRIEAIRRLGKELEVTGADTRLVRERMRRIERQIRMGRLGEALRNANRLLFDIEMRR